MKGWNDQRAQAGLKAGPYLVVALVLLVAACERESRPFDKLSVVSRQPSMPVLSQIFPGGTAPQMSGTSPFQDNAYGISEGKRLFNNYNCSGCHANGGGGMGPALIDDKWIYGSAPANIFATIVEGRPNGMPAWKGKIPDEQVWQIVAYIQSMSGQSSIDSLPGRTDHMSVAPAENARQAQEPYPAGSPQ
jgi:cytochrome c oxidase cbb3-type subunit 3